MIWNNKKMQSFYQWIINTIFQKKSFTINNSTDKLSECKSRSNLYHYLNWMKTMLKKHGPSGLWPCGWTLEIVHWQTARFIGHLSLSPLGPVRDDNFMVGAATVPYMTHSPCLSYFVHASYKYLCVSTLRAIVYMTTDSHW